MFARLLSALAHLTAAAARLWRVLAGTLLIVFAFVGPPGIGAAQDHNTRVLESAVAAYAVLRAINASLSTAKETTLGVELFGSVEGKPAMVLDPVDETVARISGALFALAGFSALLAVFFAPAAQVGAAVAGTGLVAVGLARRFDWPRRGAIWAGIWRATTLGLFFALVLPLGYATGGWIGDRATQARLDTALGQLQGEEANITRSIAAVSDEAGRPAPEAVPEARQGPQRDGEASVMDRVFGNLGEGANAAVAAGRQAVDGLRRQADEARQAVPDMAQVQERGGAIVESGIALVAVYVARLLVFPLLTLLFLWVFLRRAVV